MQKVLSCQDRLEKIVADILIDMETRDRLKSGAWQCDACLWQHLRGMQVLRTPG